jgi:hypothetical protein
VKLLKGKRLKSVMRASNQLGFIFFSRFGLVHFLALQVSVSFGKPDKKALWECGLSTRLGGVIALAFKYGG